MAGRELPPGYAADDSAALVFAGTELLACVASRKRAGVRQVTVVGPGVVQSPMPIRRLGESAEPSAGAPSTSYHDRLALAELRALRSARRSLR